MIVGIFFGLSLILMLVCFWMSCRVGSVRVMRNVFASSSYTFLRNLMILFEYKCVWKFIINFVLEVIVILNGCVCCLLYVSYVIICKSFCSSKFSLMLMFLDVFWFLCFLCVGMMMCLIVVWYLCLLFVIFFCFFGVGVGFGLRFVRGLGSGLGSGGSCCLILFNFILVYFI